MLEQGLPALETRWAAWGRWHPRLGTTLLILLALLATGWGATAGLEYVLDLTGSSVVSAFWLGASPLLLGVVALGIRESRQNLPLRILLLLCGYTALALLVLVLVSAPAMDEEAVPYLDLNGGLGTGGLAILTMSWLLFLPTVRSFLARFLPIDARDFAHAFAVAMGVSAVSLSLLSLASFDEPFLYRLPAVDTVDQSALALARNVSLLTTTILSVPAVLLAVGFSRSLNLQESWTRLGFKALTRKRLLLPLLFSVLLVGAGIGMGKLIEQTWQSLGIPVTDPERFAEIAGLPWQPLGMLLLGVSAGVSEEMFVRGVMQPRLGLVFSNVLFTSAHAFQYATDGLLVVLIMGFAFGIIRERYGLLPAIATHALYNFILLLLSTFTDIG